MKKKYRTEQILRDEQKKKKMEKAKNTALIENLKSRSKMKNTHPKYI